MSRGASARNIARRIELLRRRAEHLERRIAADPARQADRDKAEAAALRWAVDELERIYPPQRKEPGHGL